MRISERKLCIQLDFLSKLHRNERNDTILNLLRFWLKLKEMKKKKNLAPNNLLGNTMSCERYLSWYSRCITIQYTAILFLMCAHTFPSRKRNGFRSSKQSSHSEGKVKWNFLVDLLKYKNETQRTERTKIGFFCVSFDYMVSLCIIIP